MAELLFGNDAVLVLVEFVEDHDEVVQEDQVLVQQELDDHVDEVLVLDDFLVLLLLAETEGTFLPRLVLVFLVRLRVHFFLDQFVHQNADVLFLVHDAEHAAALRNVHFAVLAGALPKLLI